MAKLETIEGKSTNWGGLWWHPETNCFSSQVMSLAQLRKFKGNVRLYVRKNRFYNSGENNRPNYNFQLRDANSDNPFKLDVEDMEETTEQKVERLAEVLRAANANADMGQNPWDSRATADMLHAEACEILQELTGARWEFTFTTWGF